jgi:hypothetical protein
MLVATDGDGAWDEGELPLGGEPEPRARNVTDAIVRALGAGASAVLLESVAGLNRTVLLHLAITRTFPDGPVQTTSAARLRDSVRADTVARLEGLSADLRTDLALIVRRELQVDGVDLLEHTPPSSPDTEIDEEELFEGELLIGPAGPRPRRGRENDATAPADEADGSFNQTALIVSLGVALSLIGCITCIVWRWCQTMKKLVDDETASPDQLWRRQAASASTPPREPLRSSLRPAQPAETIDLELDGSLDTVPALNSDTKPARTRDSTTAPRAAPHAPKRAVPPPPRAADQRALAGNLDWQMAVGLPPPPPPRASPLPRYNPAPTSFLRQNTPEIGYWDGPPRNDLWRFGSSERRADTWHGREPVWTRSGLPRWGNE